MMGRGVRIGLTGPIGCGKSTVADWLAAEGAVTIDADQVAREVTPPGSPQLAAVVAEFGTSVLQADGSLDRAALGRIVFREAAALRRLEAIIHPAVRPRILERIAAAEFAGAPAVIIEAIKLVEGGLASLCDEVWLVACSPESQRTRLAARGAAAGADLADTAARIATQADFASRLTPAATRILDTSEDRDTTRAAVRAAYEDALRAAAGR